MHRSKILGLALCSATSVAALSAGAQPVPGAPAATIETVIVTAEKRNEKINDVPMSIAAFTGDQLKDRGVKQVDDLQNMVPGFTARPGDRGAPVYSIRGVGYFDISIAASPAVSVYVDQVPLPFSIMTQGVALDLQRVEVLKGPQGTLFGENSTGGAINFIANKPTQTFEAGVDVGVGNYGAVNADGFLSGPISDTLTARIALSTDQRGDWQQSETRDATLGQRNFANGRFLLDWNPTDTLSFELNVNGFLNRSDTQAAQFVAFAPQNPAGDTKNFAYLAAYKPAGDHPTIADWDPNTNFTRDDTLFQTSLHADWSLSPSMTLTSISAYSNYHARIPFDLDGTPLEAFHPTDDGYLVSFTQELRLAGDSLDDKLKWMVGGNFEYDSTYHQDHGIVDYSTTTIGPIKYPDIATFARQITNTEAAFASLDYTLPFDLTLSGSLRYTESDDRFRGCLKDSGDGFAAAAFSLIAATPIGPGQCVTLDPVTFVPVPIVAKSLNEDNLSWRVGLSWKADEGSLVYANITKGYKAGSFGVLPALFPDQLDPVVQEAVLAYEAGFKQTLLEDTLQLNGAFFYYDYSNKQTQGTIATAFGFLPTLVTVPKSHVIGGELEADWRPLDGLTLSANATYVESRILSHELIPDPLGNQIDVYGESFPNTPKYQLSADAEYDFPLASQLSGFVGADVSYRSASYAVLATTALPDFRLPGYGLLDLRGGVQSDSQKWRLELWGRNVTDEFYVLSVIHYSDTIARYAGMPATYGVTLSYRY